MSITRRPVTQAWIVLRADDPEAVSAFAVARTRLAAGRRLVELRRARLVELTGTQRPRRQVERLLHASCQFYNPHKERCSLRASPSEPLPEAADDACVLVWERGGERRGAAERWWRHETGEDIEVREGVVWMLRFSPGIEPAEAAGELTRVRDARHGLLCNPWSQASRLGNASTELPWIDAGADASPGGAA
jgi:hypothetical protein